MVTLIDVLHKMCPDTFRGNDRHYDFNVCITGDVEASESEFMARYGAGNTYYFRLENYLHGRKLAAALYRRLTGSIYNLPEELLYKYRYDRNMYFFVHVKEGTAIAAC
jgi:hypothetical protein